jgi:hypothetical protein
MTAELQEILEQYEAGSKDRLINYIAGSYEVFKAFMDCGVPKEILQAVVVQIGLSQFAIKAMEIDKYLQNDQPTNIKTGP